MSTFKPLISKCLNETYMIRNRKGEVYQVIMTYNEKERKWQSQKTFIVNMEWNPKYIFPGHFLKDIPYHCMKPFFEIQKTNKLVTKSK